MAVTDAPLPLLPRLPLRSLADLERCAEEIHSDRCQWMGESAVRPCTCGVPRTIRAMAAIWLPSDPADAGTSVGAD